MHVVVATNPAARFGRSGNVGERVLERLRESGYGTITHEVGASWNDLLQRTRQSVFPVAGLKADALVVVGGDGMVHLGVNVVGGTDVPLLVVPSGSGNDFAKTIGMVGVDATIERIPRLLAGEPDVCDLIRVRHADGVALAAGIVSVGFDADVNLRSQSLRGVPTVLRYRAAIGITLARLKHRDFAFSIDGGAVEHCNTVIFAIANHTSYGGGIPIAPTASAVDGKLTAVIADPMSKLQVLRLLPKVLRGEHLGDPLVHVREFEHITMEADGVIASADGEVLGPAPLDIRVLPDALRVFGAPE